MRALRLMLKTLWSPGEAFGEIRDSRVGPWIPFLVFIVFGVAGTYLMTNRIDIGEAAMRDLLQSPQAGNVSQEQMDQMREFSGSPYVTIGLYVASVLFTLVTVIVAGLFFVIFLILGNRSSFMSFWSVTTFAFTPMMLNTVAGTAVMYTIPPAAMRLSQLNVLSPAIFLDPQMEAGALYTLAQALSLTTIWVLVLLIIGYGVVASTRFGAGLRTVVVLTPWLFLVAIRVLPALLF